MVCVNREVFEVYKYMTGKKIEVRENVNYLPNKCEIQIFVNNELKAICVVTAVGTSYYEM